MVVTMLYLGNFLSMYEKRASAKSKKMFGHRMSFQLICEAKNIKEACSNFKKKIMEKKKLGGFEDIFVIHCSSVIEILKKLDITMYINEYSTEKDDSYLGYEPDPTPEYDEDYVEMYTFTPDSDEVLIELESMGIKSSRKYTPFVIFPDKIKKKKT
jgi:hypothetical protein